MSNSHSFSVPLLLTSSILLTAYVSIKIGGGVTKYPAVFRRIRSAISPLCAPSLLQVEIVSVYGYFLQHPGCLVPNTVCSFCKYVVDYHCLIEILILRAAGSILCGSSVEYALSNPSHHCLLHNSTTSAVATAIVVHHSKARTAQYIPESSDV